MKFLEGYKTSIAMGLALGVALWQHFVGVLPVVNQELWNIVVPVVAIVLRFVTKTPIFTSSEK